MPKQRKVFLVNIFLILTLSISVAVSLNADDKSRGKQALFLDTFEYAVSRDGDTYKSFVGAGWNYAKANNLGNSGAHGNLYTTDTIPGYSGPFPGKNSTRVLALEGLATSLGGQTDFYLHFGGDYDDQVPADVWFQFWLYTNNYDDPTDQNDQMSRFSNHPKFIYPTKGGYPNRNSLWIINGSHESKAPLRADTGLDSNEFFFYLADLENISYTGGNKYKNAWKIGQQNLDEHIIPNRWALIKIHIDTSTVNPVYEQWIKPMGGEWVKVAEWIQGVTPGLNWTIAPDDVGGHKAFRMPTTQNPCRNKKLSCDNWQYLDDFAMATSEEQLPTYSH